MQSRSRLNSASACASQLRSSVDLSIPARHGQSGPASADFHFERCKLRSSYQRLEQLHHCLVLIIMVNSLPTGQCVTVVAPASTIPLLFIDYEFRTSLVEIWAKMLLSLRRVDFHRSHQELQLSAVERILHITTKLNISFLDLDPNGNVVRSWTGHIQSRTTVHHWITSDPLISMESLTPGRPLVTLTHSITFL